MEIEEEKGSKLGKNVGRTSITKSARRVEAALSNAVDHSQDLDAEFQDYDDSKFMDDCGEGFIPWETLPEMKIIFENEYIM